MADRHLAMSVFYPLLHGGIGRDDIVGMFQSLYFLGN
jgi:hypothetical protein